MEHPLIGDISHLTEEDLSQRISDLQKKIGIAQRTGNGHLVSQLSMALETFRNQYQAKLNAKNIGNASPDFSSMINIE